MTKFKMPAKVLVGGQHVTMKDRHYFHRFRPGNACVGFGSIRTYCGVYLDPSGLRDGPRILAKHRRYVPCSRNGCFPGWWKVWDE